MCSSTVLERIRHGSERATIPVIIAFASQLDLQIEVYALVSDTLIFAVANLIDLPIPAEVALNLRVSSINPI